jgi:hypothetical protein
MFKRLAVLALTALVLSGCAAVNCGGSDDSGRGGGGCRAHTTF